LNSKKLYIRSLYFLIFVCCLISVNAISEMKPISTENSQISNKQTQPHFRGVMSPMTFREDDLKTLGVEWNANLIRWQLNCGDGYSNSVKNLDEYDQWLDNKLNELDKVVSACTKYGIKLVIDLHSPPGGMTENRKTAMFYDKRYNVHFISVWEKIAKRYKNNPIIWGYDLVNEPIQDQLSPKGMGCIETEERAAKAIRNIDLKTPIIIEVDRWDSQDGFKYLQPINVSNVIYEAHMYTPIEYTHQGVISKLYDVNYPGIIAGKLYNKETLRNILKPVRDFQLAYNAHIYIGEFSAIRWAPGAAQYLSDCIDIFEEYGWDWTYHAYREWSGWSVEYENGKADKIAIKNTDRKNLLLYWFQKNIKPQ
jgi:endoglucanase